MPILNGNCRIDMQDNIIFFQTTFLGGADEAAGLFNILYAKLANSTNKNVFEKLQIVVPNQAMAIFLKDQVAKSEGICANLDFVVLLGPVLQNYYIANNPGEVIFEFSKAKFIIYDYLLSMPFKSSDAKEINQYIIVDDQVDKFRAFQLACQLEQIFHEYLYLRTEDLINLSNSNFPTWQKQTLNYLFRQISPHKTFLDIYKYFATLDLEQAKLKLPDELFIFGLTSVYPSQLQIIKKLANKINIFWYHQTCSFEYYGDLLTTKARARLEKKLLRKPELSLDDLYLTDGNPLLANLGQQSREFIELLNANDIEVYSFKPEQNHRQTANTYLSIIQDDIRQIKYRIEPLFRLERDNRFYADPIRICNADAKSFYDLENQLSSIKINICHNKMREVQVMFNELVALLDKNPKITLDQILITAPDIDNYASYITAVFDNEIMLKSNGESCKLLYNITGNRLHKDYKIIATTKLILNAPYLLTVNYFIEILMQSEIQHNLELDARDIELVKTWLSDNATNFGYTSEDYEEYGYANYSVHSFKQFLNNLVLGACLNDELIINSQALPYLRINNKVQIPYDNLDSNQIELCNKLINLITILEQLRTFFYLDANIPREFCIAEIHNQLNNLKEILIINDADLLIFDEFLGSLLNLDTANTITLPILNLILNSYIDSSRKKIRFDGTITCASMQYMRNIPFNYIYVLGLNFGEFPSNYNPNQLSILARDWYLADRNYNIEDKQAFLDIVLAAKKQLFFSYIGRKETDNSIIKPSPILELFIRTFGQSFLDFKDNNDPSKPKYHFANILVQHSLHPFYNNREVNYSALWHKIAQSCNDTQDFPRWDFSKTSRIYLTEQQKLLFYRITVKQLLTTFLFTNANLYRVLGISQFTDEIELNDNESLTLYNRSLAATIYEYFEFYLGNAQVNQEKLKTFLKLKGILGYEHIGNLQFEHYYNIYQGYKANRGLILANFKLEYTISRDHEPILIEIEDALWVEGNAVIITDNFETIRGEQLASKMEEIPYALKFKALIVAGILGSKPSFQDIDGQIDQVIIRQINIKGEKRDFIVAKVEKNIFENILKYYLRSLANPVLIHKAAIEEFAKSSLETDRAGNRKNTLDQCILRARAKYLQDYKNYDLDRAKQDMIFAGIAEDYFEFIKSIGGVNDIIKIGEILTRLNQ